MPIKETSASALRIKRSQLQDLQERRRLRLSYGPRFASIVAHALKKPLDVDNFDGDAEEPFAFEWKNDIASAQGLVAAYIPKTVAVELLGCFQEKLVYLSGKIGFHEKNYLGLAEVERVDPTSLLLIAEAAEDSVLFYTDQPRGAILIDCYRSQPTEPFSIVVQGGDLIQELASCFMRWNRMDD